MSDFNICHACHGVGEIDRAVEITEGDCYIDKITCPYCGGRGQYRGAPIVKQNSLSTKEAQARQRHYSKTLYYCLDKYGPVEFVNHLGEELKRGKHGLKRVT